MNAFTPLRRAILLGLMLLWSSLAAADPNGVIESAADELDRELSGRRDELAADEQALYALINQILLPRFERKYAARLVLGKHWNSASCSSERAPR